MELLTQFMALNDEKYLSKTTKNYFIKFSDMSIDLKYAWNCIYTLVTIQGLMIFNGLQET